MPCRCHAASGSSSAVIRSSAPLAPAALTCEKLPCGAAVLAAMCAWRAAEVIAAAGNRVRGVGGCGSDVASQVRGGRRKCGGAVDTEVVMVGLISLCVCWEDVIGW